MPRHKRKLKVRSQYSNKIREAERTKRRKRITSQKRDRMRYEDRIYA